MILLCFDPGETTGYAVLVDGAPVEWGAFPWWSRLRALIEESKWGFPDGIVCERFSLYAQKAAVMVNNEFAAAQVIGVVRFLAEQRGILVHLQPASCIHSGRALSPLLRPLVDSLKIKGVHARDAVAHGLWWFRFGHKEHTQT